MYIYKRKLKSDTVYYLCKSYCDPNTGKNSSKIVERIGTFSELKDKHKDLDAWLKKYAKEKTAQENQKHSVYSINFDSGKRLNRKEVHRFNAGYFVLQKICYKLGINKICDEIAKEAGYKGDFTKIFLALIYDHIMFTEIDGSFRPFIKEIIESLNVTDQQIIKVIEIISDYSSQFQYKLSENARKYLNYDCSLVFNQCANYCYGVNQYSPKNKSDIKTCMKVIKLDIFTDKNGIPLGYLNNSSEKANSETRERIINALKYWEENSQIISFKDNLPSKLIEELSQECDNCKFIQNVNTKILKPHLKKWILDSDGWNAWGNDSVYNLDEVYNTIYAKNTTRRKKDRLDNIIFYKVYDINDKKKLIAGFNFVGQREDRQIRNDRYEKVKQLLDKQLAERYEDDPEAFKEFIGKFRKFLKKNISEESIKENYIYEFDSEGLDKEIAHDGLYACLCDSDIEDYASVINQRFNTWLVDYNFKSMKNEFKTIPNTLDVEKSINAHLLVSFTSLMVAQVLQKILKDNFSLRFVRDAMVNYDFVKVTGIGWIPTFTPSSIYDLFDKFCEIRTDYEFISDADMKEIIKKIKG